MTLSGDKESLQSLLHKFIENPEDDEINFYLGLVYHELGQTASAVSFYLRTAERSDDDLLKFEALLRAGMCFESQGCRNYTVESMLQHAITICPDRPEGYYFLSRFYEKTKKWFESYFIASIGHKMTKESKISLRSKLDYPGYYGNLFEKAVSGYWVGLGEESKSLFKELVKLPDLDGGHYQAVFENLKFYKEFENSIVPYHSDMWTKLKYQFEGSTSIVENYSEAFQDMFVLSMLDGKRNGTYLELGSGDPFKGSNTVLLETKFGWTGLSLDTDVEYVKSFSEKRKNPVEFKDAVNVNYEKLLDYYDLPEVIDYLQLDLEPGEVTFEALLKIPFDKYKFKVITYEHDHYLCRDKTIRERSREYLQNLGYKLVVANMSPDDWKVYEDWYVHPDLVDSNIVNQFLTLDRDVVQPKDLFFLNKVQIGDLKNKYWTTTKYPSLEFTTSIPKNGCIVDCVFCPQRLLTGEYTGNKTLTFENFKVLLAKIPKEVRIAFSGFTEPFLNKECADMMVYAHNEGHEISLFTTGIGMSVEDLKKIKDLPFSAGPNGGFIFHFPDQENYAKHPRSKKYDELLQYLSTMYWEIDNFGVMCMGTIRDDAGKYFAQPEPSQMYDRAGNLSREAILKPELLQVEHLYKTTQKTDKPMTCNCFERLYHNVVLPNGDISLCCMDYNLEAIIGNLFEQDYDDIMPEPYSTFNICQSCENRVSPEELKALDEVLPLPVYERPY